MNHEELVGLAKSHFSGVSFEYEGDAVPVLSPCRFTGSEVRFDSVLHKYFSFCFITHLLFHCLTTIFFFSFLIHCQDKLEKFTEFDLESITE